MHQIYSPTPLHTLPHTFALIHLAHLKSRHTKTHFYTRTLFYKVRFSSVQQHHSSFPTSISTIDRLPLSLSLSLSLSSPPLLFLPSHFLSLSHTHTYTISCYFLSLSLALWHPLSHHTCGDNASPEINPLASIWCQVDLYLIPSHRRTWLILLTSVAIDGVVVVAVFDVAVVIKRDRRDIVPIDAIKAAFAAANQTLNRS